MIHKAGDVNDPSNFRPIALTSCVGKVFHQILSERICKYLVSNGFINTELQKAFIGKISGCQDHNLIMQELINHAKGNKRTIHITWFDLEDAFGSVSHDLIPICLSRMHLPQNVKDYIVSLYSTLRGKVRTSEWTSEQFSFNKGVFQGDPLSLIIFLMCFNPTIEDLMKFEESDGYGLEGKFFISLPFADDFNLITCGVRKHRTLMTCLQDLTSSMGLKLKPRKCKSLSIKAGKSVDIGFFLGDSLIGSILNDAYHKFLGGIFTFACTPSSVASVVEDKIRKHLINIDELMVRKEYKARIYSDYLLGSLRFLFSIHDLHKRQIETLEALTHRYLKKWLGLPRGASWALVHDSHGMNVKSISHLYLESRSLTLSLIRFFSDGRVRHALDSKEDREDKWRRKFSSAIYVKGLIEEVVTPVVNSENSLTLVEPLNDSQSSWSSLEVEGILSPVQPSPSRVSPPPPPPPVSFPSPPPPLPSHPLLSSHSSQPQSPPPPPSSPILPQPLPVHPPPTELTSQALKRKIQRGVQERVNNFWREKIGRYIMQGDYLALIIEEGGM